MAPRIEIKWGRFTTDVFYGPGEVHPCYGSAYAWACEYRRCAKEQRPEDEVSVVHYFGTTSEVLSLED